MNIRLYKMTKDLCRQYFSAFEYDPDVLTDTNTLSKFIYNTDWADRYWQKQIDLNRVYLAIMLDNEPIGEVILKRIDWTKKLCTLSIHMQNDSVKNRGYGTQAEILALMYAFNELGMETVLADALHKNTRSQHVLKKVGFVETGCDDAFQYYKCCKHTWKAPHY